MAEGLSTLDGETLSIDADEAAFAAAMAAPPVDQPGMAAPAKKPPEPEPDEENAPHGWTYTGGQWRPKRAPGRRASSKADKARVTEAPPVPPKVAPSGGGRDWRKPLKEAAEGLWFLLAAAPVPDKAFGYNLGGLRTRLRVQAHLVEQNVDGLVAGINTLGQHNRFVARGLERLKQGEGGLWILPTMMLLAPFASSTAALWGGQLGDAESLDAVASKVEADVKTYVESLAETAMAEAAVMEAAVKLQG